MLRDVREESNVFNATCGHGRVYARGVCRTCHRKLGSVGLPIGPDGRQPANVAKALRQRAERLSSDPQEYLDVLAANLTTDARERLEAALQKARGG